MTSTQQAKHPARWPLLDLDVAKIRAAGQQAVPFRQFILKVHSRCNLSCSYCYVYEMADQGWRGLPKRMSSRWPAEPSSALLSTRKSTAFRASMSSCTAVSRCSQGRSGWPASSARSAQGPRPGERGPPDQRHAARPSDAYHAQEPGDQGRRQPGRGRRGDRAAPALRQRPQQLRRGRRRASTCCSRRSSGTATAASCARSISRTTR